MPIYPENIYKSVAYRIKTGTSPSIRFSFSGFFTEPQIKPIFKIIVLFHPTVSRNKKKWKLKRKCNEMLLKVKFWFL